MFGTVVLGLPDEPFEEELARWRARRDVGNDADLGADDLRAITLEFKRIVRERTGADFPGDPLEQLRRAIAAVFDSWNGKRAIDYRNAAGIAHDLGTAVNVMTMVFGNMGAGSGTGVVTTRDVTTGVREIEGDYLTNAQGEDVVSGVRATKPIAALATEMPRIYRQFAAYCRKLEKHYREVQDVEFTIERGKLWMLQTRDAKRTIDITKSYDLTIHKTVKYVLENFSQIPNCIEINSKIIDGFKSSGGFNDEVDLTYVAILSLVAAKKLDKSQHEFTFDVISNADSSGISSVEKYIEKLVDMSDIKIRLSYPGIRNDNLFGVV